VTRFVPQRWLNAFAYGRLKWFANSNDTSLLNRYQAQGGNFLVHLERSANKADIIGNYSSMSHPLPELCKNGTMRRDVSDEVAEF
jgi:hypothetical protein